MNNYEGNFVVIEGTDKSGKSTLIENLQEELDECEFTKEPSEGKYGRVIRKELQSDSDPNLADVFLFLADRYDHCHSLIGPLLEQGKTVICDRYQLSTFAYQSPVVREDCNMKQGRSYIESITSPWLIRPDLTIYLDVPVEVSLDRLDDDAEKYETRQELVEAKAIYERLWAENDHIRKIDARWREEEVLADALTLIEELE